MSVKIERNELLDIARSVYSGGADIEAYLKKNLKQRPIAGIFHKIEEKLWRMIVEEHPLRDYSGEKESLTRTNILKRICTVIKSKFFFHISCLSTSMWFR